MPKHRNLLIVLADGAGFRLLREAEDHGLHGISPEQAGFAVPPVHDGTEHEKERFAHHLAEQINQADRAGMFGELIVAAPAHTMGPLRAALTPGAAAKLVGAVSKELMHVPDHALQPHFADWLRPVHRAG